MRRLTLSFLLSFALLPCAARPQVASNVVSIGTIDSIRSATLKEYRRFLVHMPASYSDTTFTPQRYPVLYLLDGDSHFPSVAGMVQILSSGVNATYLMPEMIVVAIPNTDRMRDMTPTYSPIGADGKPGPVQYFKTSGGMANFFQFLETELIPHIDRTYRTAPYRVFIGHSLGGITTINALYTKPRLFNAYVAIDPSLWWDDRLLLKQAKSYFTKAALEGRTLVLAQAHANSVNPDDTLNSVHSNAMLQFTRILESNKQSGLRYAYKYYPDDDHGSVPFIAEYDALRFIFDGYKVDLGRAIDDPQYLVKHFAEVSERLGYRMLPPEPMIDLVGRAAILRDSTKAVAVYELNAKLYPTSPHARSMIEKLKGQRPD
jgi:predicted alpha/beta superfamily hydrolase